MSFKFWLRWDPRLGPAPLRTALRARRWVIEVVPDIFAPGCEAVLEQVISTIGAVPDTHKGRWVLRTAYPGEAVTLLRRLHEWERGGWPRGRSDVPSRVVLAVYAETQAELDDRVAQLRAPRVYAEELALADMDAAVALARKEGAISDYHDEEVAGAVRAGPTALAAYLEARYRYGRRTVCLGPDSGGLALYLTPRAPIDIKAALQRLPPMVYAGPGSSRVDSHPIEWVIAAGQIGPLGKGGSGPWPVHPAWFADVEAAARAASVPFCIPYIGEWACYDGGGWDNDVLPGRAPTTRVDYDPTWQWGERGWNHENHSAKPSDAHMQAVGSKIAGRAIDGQIFDDWPLSWVSR